MKKVLGIIGSPRRLGNCEITVKEIARHISVPNELRLLRLADFEILPCRGCYACLFNERRCPQKDDFYKVLDAVIESDALILAVPTYFLGPNSCLKQFLDRGLALYAYLESLWGKPAVGVGIAGIKGKDGYTLLGIESFLKLIFSTIKQAQILYGALPGEVFLDAENKAAAQKLASALFGPPRELQGPRCPLCGGASFRFIEVDRVQCLLCSNFGTLNLDAGKPVLAIEPSSHELFLSKKAALEHEEWLIGMRARFMQNKKTLKEITGVYLKEGVWIKP
jgi:multimeric flavodoxin WrbA